MESCKSCSGEIETKGNFCPRCGSSQSDEIISISFRRRILNNYCLAIIAVGVCMIPLSMTARGLIMFPLISSLFIMGGLTVYVLSRFGAWWE
jgi:hypothetical protein